jgi:hypothetical protein
VVRSRGTRRTTHSWFYISSADLDLRVEGAAAFRVTWRREGRGTLF